MSHQPTVTTRHAPEAWRVIHTTLAAIKARAAAQATTERKAS